MNNCSVALQVLPQIDGNLKVCGIDDKEMIRIIDEVITYIKSTNVKHVVGPFETTMEGDFNELMEIVKRAQEIVLESGGSAVLSYVKIAFNPKGVLTIEEKTEKHQ